MHPSSEPQPWHPSLTPETMMQLIEQTFVVGRFAAVLKQPVIRPFPDLPVYTRGWWHTWPRKPLEID